MKPFFMFPLDFPIVARLRKNPPFHGDGLWGANSNGMRGWYPNAVGKPERGRKASSGLRRSFLVRQARGQYALTSRAMTLTRCWLDRHFACMATSRRPADCSRWPRAIHHRRQIEGAENDYCRRKGRSHIKAMIVGKYRRKRRL